MRNIEKAVTKVCSPKGYAVLLHFGDKFNRVDALSEIAKTVEDRQVVGAGIGLVF